MKTPGSRIEKFGFYLNFMKQLLLKLFQHSEEASQLLCEKSNIKNEIQQYWFNHYLNGDGEAEIYGLHEHYGAKDLIVKELKYKIDEDMLCIDGEYDLTIEFGFERVLRRVDKRLLIDEKSFFEWVDREKKR